MSDRSGEWRRRDWQRRPRRGSEEGPGASGDPYDYYYRSSRPRGAPGDRYGSYGPPRTYGSRRRSRSRPPRAYSHRGRPSGGRPGRTRRRGRLGRKVTAVLAVVVLLLVGVFVYVDLRLTKVNALTDYEGRPPATPGQDWLLVGSDSRQGLTAEQRKKFNTGKAAGQRTDTIMLLHISRFGGRATLVSLPRDSLVDIPAYTDDDGDRHPAREDKLNTAYALGGPQLLARTVETETGIRLDHYMEIGFGGFAAIVNAVGGVRLCLDQPIQDKKSGASLEAGCQTLNGEEALAYVRARYSVAGGDLGRVQHQRKLLRALSGEISSPTTWLNPIALIRLLHAGAGALVVDEHTGPFDLLWFGWHMKRLTGGGGATITVPIAEATTVSGEGAVVLWDREEALALFRALRQDEPVPESVVRDRS